MQFDDGSGVTEPTAACTDSWPDSDPLDIVALGRWLFGVTPDSVRPVESATLLKTESDDTLRIARNGGALSYGQGVRFERGLQHRIERVTCAGVPYYRWRAYLERGRTERRGGDVAIQTVAEDG